MARNGRGKLTVLLIPRVLLSCSLLVGLIYGQLGRTQVANERTAEVADAIAKVRSGKFNGYHVGIIGEARAVEAVPDLEKQFTRTSEPIEKAKIAQVLLLLGDRKDVYWNYLVEAVKPALETDVPSPIHYDTAGKSVQGLSQDFVTWAQAHGQSPDQAGENAVYILPGIVMMLGSTADPRAVPFLRQALSSPNYQIAAAAAMGIAETQDVISIPTVISRCKGAPAEAAGSIAESLVYFNDPRAQDAVDTFVPKEHAKALREARKMGRGPLHR